MTTFSINSKHSSRPELKQPSVPESIFLIEKRMQKHRIVVTGSYLFLGCFAYALDAIHGHMLKVLPAIAFMPLSSLVSLQIIKRRPEILSCITAISLILDTLLISWVIFWTGGIESPCLPFYLTTVMAASFRFGPQGSLFYALLAMVCYSVAGLLPVVHPNPFQNLANLAIRILFLFAAAGFGIRALHQKLDRYRKERTLRRALEKANQKLKRAYQELEEAQDQLLHAEKLASIGRLVAGVAHEINNPISFITGNLIHLGTYVRGLKTLLSFYETQALPETIQEQRDALKHTIDYDFLWTDIDQALNASANGAERIKKIVADLLNFSRMHKGPLQTIKAESPLENALSLLESRHSRGIRVVRDYKDGCMINGDGHELSQLFLNLLTNAADAVEGQGTIWVRSYRDHRPEHEPRALIEIEDTGPGIPLKDRERIFEPFFTTKDIGKGTGLGLAIAYSITKRHKGELSAHTPGEKGTLFRIALPMAKTD